MSLAPRPNPLALWLLRQVLARAEADAVVGDALEELQAHEAAGRSPRRTRTRLTAEVLRAAGAAVIARTPAALRSLGHSVRDAARSVRRSPASAMFIMGILAVGIAAGTITFSVVDAIVLKPLPIDHSERIVNIRWQSQSPDWTYGIWSEGFQAIHDRASAFDGVAYCFGHAMPVGSGSTTFDANVMNCTSDQFRVFGISPMLGRTWTPAEDASGPDVAVISNSLWRSRFGSDPAAVGRVVQIFKRAYEVIGVAQAGAGALGDGHDVDVWVPATRQLASDFAQHVRVYPTARLRPGQSIAEAEREIRSVIAPQVAARPADYQDGRIDVQRWDIALIGEDTRGWLLLLLGAVGLIVLIACVNAANLMLTRSAGRARDLAIRASLGASRRALALSLLFESLMLSAAAGAVALLISVWGVGAAKASLPPGPHLFRAGSIALDARVFFAAVAAALMTGVLFGAVPAWQASRTSVVSILKEGGTGATVRRGWRTAFLTCEIGCVAVLLVVSALFIDSFIHVLTRDLGIDRSHLLAVSTVSDYQGTVDDLKDRLGAIPGVTGAAAVTVSSLPIVGRAYGGAWHDTPVEAVDSPAGGTSKPITVDAYRVTPDLFHVAGMPMLQGSAWRAGVANDPRPMVIDELAAKRLFGTGDPLGKRIHAKELQDQTFTVTGVVRLAATMGPEAPARAAVYYDMRPGEHPSWVSFFLRTAGPPALLAHSVEASLAQVARPDPSGGAGVHVVDDGFSLLTATRRFTAGLMTTFALFALFIGAAGIYAVMASVVAKQTKEIGVRVALGATAADIRRGVVGAATRHVAAGLAIGLPVAWWIAGGFRGLFFEVGPTDASVYFVVAATILVVGLVAAIVPARRAARVDPVVSLRAS